MINTRIKLFRFIHKAKSQTQYTQLTIILTHVDTHAEKKKAERER